MAKNTMGDLLKKDENTLDPLDPTNTFSKVVPKVDTTPAEPQKPFRPVRAGAAGMAEGVNLGAAGVASTLNSLYNFIREKSGIAKLGTEGRWGTQPDFFKPAMDKYMENAQYWENIAKKHGISTAWHFLTKALGGIPGGIADWEAGVVTAGVRGAQEAKEKGESQVLGAAKGAAVRATMGQLLKAAAPYSRPVRMGTGGAAFAGQAAIEGERDPEKLGEAAITGAAFGAPGGKGKYTVKDINDSMGQRGAIGSNKPPQFMPALKVGDQVFTLKPGEPGTHGHVYDTVPPELLKRADNGELDLESGFTDATGKWYTTKEARESIGKSTSSSPKPDIPVPAVKHKGKWVSGERGDTHPDVMARNEIGPDAGHTRGFMVMDNGKEKYLSRAQAKQWMKKNNPTLYNEWVKTVEEGGEGKGKELHSQDLNKAQGLPENKHDNGTNLGMGLGGAPDFILKGLDRWLSPTKEHLSKQGEPAMPAEEWSKRVKAWGEKNKHIQDENTWSGLNAWLDSNKGRKIQREDMMNFLELSKGNWAVQEMTYGLEPKEKTMLISRIKELEKKGDKLTGNEERELRVAHRALETATDPWAENNVPGGIPGTAKVWTLTLPSTEKVKDINYPSEMEFLNAQLESRAITPQEYSRQTGLLANRRAEVKKGDGSTYWSPHFYEKPNVILHFRTQEIKDGKGNKGILVESIQSDWHQKGRDVGYGSPEVQDPKLYRKLRQDAAVLSRELDKMKENPVDTPEFYQKMREVYKKRDEARAKVTEYQDRIQKSFDRVPDAPFKDTWAEVGLKHAIDLAVQDPSIKWIGWSDGKVQNERWGMGEARALDLEGMQEALANREITKKQFNDFMVERGDGRDTFLQQLYDKRLPKFAKNYTKKLGGKYSVDTIVPSNPVMDKLCKLDEELKKYKRGTDEYNRLNTEIGDLMFENEGLSPKRLTDKDYGYGVHRIDITPDMRHYVNTKGQEFYSMTAPVAGAAAGAALKKDDTKREDGTDKGPGWLGNLKMKDGSGKTATELSIGVKFDGEERLIPALVPGLTAQEIDHLLKGGKPTRTIIDKAVFHARKMTKQGKSPFKPGKVKEEETK